MFQLPQLASGSSGLMKGSGPERSDSVPGLEGLLQATEGSLAGFSGDLQAMLMQMTPQMLERLDELLAGGMNLPQAARSLLAESGIEGAGELFADFLKQGMPALEQLSGAESVPPSMGPDGEIAKLAESLLARGGGSLADLAQTLSVPASATAVPMQGPIPQAGPLPPPLAASLLDMGVPQQVGGGKAWQGAIADRIMWMVQGEQQFAKLQLNPPNLGPLEVRVSVNQDQASVSFMSQHAAVRDALEAAMPRLREMFDQQSMQLVRADVSDPGARQGDRAHDSHERTTAQPGTGGDEMQEHDGDSNPHTVAAATSSLIDLFV
jgi:flagellar hook-length control protein FliK